MKVVKKCDGMSEHNVLDESTDYYLCGERQGMHPYLLAKKDYEPVEEWKDVTHECTLKASVTGVYCIYRLGYVVNPSNTAHRVTCKGSTFKVEVKR